MLAMVRFDPADRLRRRNPPPIRAARRRSPRRGGGAPARRAAFRADNPLSEQAFPSWARPPTRASRRRRRRCERGFLRRRRPRAVRPNSSRTIRRSPARCASAWRCAPRPPARNWRGCAKTIAALRDAEHLASGRGANQPRRARPSPLAPVRLAAAAARRATLRAAADLLDLPDDVKLRRARRRLAGHRRRRRTSARGGRGRERRGDETVHATRRPSTPRFSRSGCRSRAGATSRLGRAGSAARHGDRASVAASRPERQAPASRRSGLGRRRGRRLCAGRPRRLRSRRRFVAPLAKSCWRPSPNCAPKAPRGSSSLLLADDAVSPARAAKVARLSDRAARRLFDRLDRARRRARTLGAAQFSALWLVRA